MCFAWYIYEGCTPALVLRFHRSAYNTCGGIFLGDLRVLVFHRFVVGLCGASFFNAHNMLYNNQLGKYFM